MLLDKAFNFAKIRNIMDMNADLLEWSIHFLISGGTVKNKNISNKELAGELYKPIIRKSKKRKVQSPFTENI